MVDFYGLICVGYLVVLLFFICLVTAILCLIVLRVPLQKIRTALAQLVEHRIRITMFYQIHQLKLYIRTYIFIMRMIYVYCLWRISPILTVRLDRF